jgi:hypothetical protein
MKTPSQILTAVLVGAITIIVVQANASAQTVTALHPTGAIIVDTVPTASQGPSNTGTTGEDGYVFYDPTGTDHGGGTERDTSDVTSETITPVSGFTMPNSYATLTTASGVDYFRAGETHITIGSTLYASGQLFINATVDVPQLLTTIALGSSVPANFDLGVLRDYPDDTAYVLSLYSGTPSPATLLSSALLDTTLTTDGSSPPVENQFFYGEVSGASAGDYLTITGAPADLGTGNRSEQVTLGGVVFDTVAPTPEPSTYALMLAGLGTLALVARLRRTS